MTVSDFVEQAHKAVDLSFIDTVLYNTQTSIDSELQAIYDADGEHLIDPGDITDMQGVEAVGLDLVAKDIVEQSKHDKVKRSLIRHDAKKLIDKILI